ncbi:hypothetical protein GJA_2894 [Janthinobacterium agaricidamnosum NBRC 102515 = DSM 9628]|uniref:Uncharacterized protein n=1 Tax=Janthinobacterium agaricidamnosum NBRC 102515 = DSM 9628 TaxID=1349767 RepID=W0V3X0_9BURK|nr:hypothetical protein GJA_2894 [Janthinobacterium agaricidamnosum NBRC 102515 = DSM 9628]
MDELAALKSDAQWTINHVHSRLDVGKQPWDDADGGVASLYKSACRMLRGVFVCVA